MLSLQKVSNKLWDKTILRNITWSPDFKQSWAILGPNGAGKSTLIKVILGQLPYCGKIKRDSKISAFNKIAYVSLGQQKALVANEEKKDLFEEYSGKEQHSQSGQDFLDPEGKQTAKLLIIAEQIGLVSLLEKPIRYFSNGEIRKTLIAKALLDDPKLLIFDEPFDGLDSTSVEFLSQIISGLIQSGLAVWLVSHRFEELVPEIKHVLCLKAGKIFAQGLRSEVLNSENIKILYAENKSKGNSKKNTISTEDKFKNLLLQKAPKPSTTNKKSPCIIKMRNVNVIYGENVVLEKFNWSVYQGENWKITGPNGAGKSTLLSLISGDNLQAYANQIYLFGRRRGTGESVWDIKQQIGLVSSEYQVSYRESVSAIKVVLSGFFDTIGYYQPASEKQKKSALNWMRFLELYELAEEDYTRLSYGQQRLILIARSMVKYPPLLILDEPCQGLDRTNRNRVLKLIDYIGLNSETQILYVSHIKTDHLNCIRYELSFDVNNNGTFRPHITEL
ncbi:MAG: ATP-binding cassette domain-containing protein [SAR324 cluster bacterium]|nr:ATP-binding cassette domain-containing protein [SAR324 cluster bacterium]